MLEDFLRSPAIIILAAVFTCGLLLGVELAQVDLPLLIRVIFFSLFILFLRLIWGKEKKKEERGCGGCLLLFLFFVFLAGFEVGRWLARTDELLLDTLLRILRSGFPFIRP